MSDRKYTPMEILRDNIRIRLNHGINGEAISIPEKHGYLYILEMIEGGSLGKPLLDQEKELLDERYQDGVNSVQSNGSNVTININLNDLK